MHHRGSLRCHSRRRRAWKISNFITRIIKFLVEENHRHFNQKESHLSGQEISFQMSAKSRKRIDSLFNPRNAFKCLLQLYNIKKSEEWLEHPHQSHFITLTELNCTILMKLRPKKWLWIINKSIALRDWSVLRKKRNNYRMVREKQQIVEVICLRKRVQESCHRKNLNNQP